MTCWPLKRVKNLVRCKQHVTPLAILHDLNLFTTIPSAMNEIELISSRGPVTNKRGVEHPDIFGSTSESFCNKENNM